MNRPNLPLRQVAVDVCVAPQLTPEAMAEVKLAGFRSVVNNRPDFEHGPDQPTNAAIEAAAVAADHHRADRGEPIELFEGLGQLAVALERQRVEALGPVEGDGPYRAVQIGAYGGCDVHSCLLIGVDGEGRVRPGRATAAARLAAARGPSSRAACSPPSVAAP